MEKNFKENLDALARNGGFQFTETFFPYTSGQIGPYCVQSVVVEKNGEDYRLAIDSMVGLITSMVGDDYEFISGGESRDWDFSNPVAAFLRKPHVKIYKNGKVLGADMKGKRGIHVADLNNEGSSPNELWVPSIRHGEGEISHIFFYVDRMEDGVHVMKDLGLESNAVVPLNSRAWDYLLKIGTIKNREIYTSLQKRTEDKGKWAEEMLRSDAGLKTLADLLNYQKKKNRTKGEKILNVGYPHLKQELLEAMRSKGFLWNFRDDELAPEPTKIYRGDKVSGVLER